jgi:hypothetical protein
LSVVLKAWQKRYKLERDPHLDRFGAGFHGTIAGGHGSKLPLSRPAVMGPWEWMEYETGIGGDVVRKIASCDREYVSLTLAEKILMAIDKEYMLVNDEIPVIPNPRWSQEKWVKYMEERGCI